MNELEKLNSLKVVDFDVDSNKMLVYVHIEDTEENREVLIDLGATEYDFMVMKERVTDKNKLDITLFAFINLSINSWSLKNGFHNN